MEFLPFCKSSLSDLTCKSRGLGEKSNKGMGCCKQLLTSFLHPHKRHTDHSGHTVTCSTTMGEHSLRNKETLHSCSRKQINATGLFRVVVSTLKTERMGHFLKDYWFIKSQKIEAFLFKCKKLFCHSSPLDKIPFENSRLPSQQL